MENVSVKINTESFEYENKPALLQKMKSKKQFISYCENDCVLQNYKV
jgi:hypothetical protein